MLKIGGKYRVKSAEKLSKILGEYENYTTQYKGLYSFMGVMWEACGKDIIITREYDTNACFANAPFNKGFDNLYWHEDWLEAKIPDSKLARRLYKNKIIGEEMENYQNYLILESL
jgi:hypothetical protein